MRTDSLFNPSNEPSKLPSGFGVRPSPGAAMCDMPSTPRFAKTFVFADVAAAGTAALRRWERPPLPGPLLLWGGEGDSRLGAPSGWRCSGACFGFRICVGIFCQRPVAYNTALAAEGATATSPKGIDARMMRYPDVSATQIAFVYAGDIWVAPKACWRGVF